jgi:alpha,alpha-trehalase
MRKRVAREYIKQSWKKALTRLETPTFSLPYPFVPPCVNGEFRVLYYWDTYFTNVGLIADGRVDWAMDNVNTLLYVLREFGCVPNCAKEHGADYASQPPLLGLMIQDVFAATGDERWLAEAVEALETEYAFWMRERITPIGLNQYGGNAKSEALLAEYYDYVATRLPLPLDIPMQEKAVRAKNFLAEGESGEDFTPRYKRHNALDYVQIDLNAHLYGVEVFLSEYYSNRDLEKSERYRKNRERRLNLLQQYCYDEERGIYFDYDFVAGERSNMICAACFLPWFYGFGVGRDGLKELFECLFSGKGVYVCQDVGDRSYQWGYPNLWAPHQFFAYEALRRNGLDAQANLLANGYVELLSETFEKTGCLWERYDNQGVAPSLEYTTQEMLGWTAGVYNHFYEKLWGKE